MMRRTNFVFFAFFVFSAPCFCADSAANCRNFISNCKEIKTECINRAEKYCGSKSNAEKVYNELAKLPVVVDGAFAPSKTTDADTYLKPPRPEGRPSLQREVSDEDKRQSYSSLRKARVKFTLKDYAKAIKECDEALAYNPYNKQAYKLRALANGYEGKYADAVADINSFLEYDEGDASVYAVRAFAHLKRGDYAKSYADASKSISLDPNVAGVFLTRAMAEEKLGKYKELLDDAYKAAKMNPQEYAGRFHELLSQYGKKADGFSYAGDIPKPAAAQSDADEMSANGSSAYIVLAGSAVVLVILVLWIVGKSKNKKIPELLHNQYKLTRKLGEGGMGEVYEAQDTALDRKVAVKKMRAGFGMSSEMRRQLLAEARLVAALHHPNILEIYTVFEERRDLYLVFEFVNGATLQDRLNFEGVLTIKEAKNIFEGVCKALDCAHKNNIVHRDLKPGNIMLSENDIVKVMDFGVARTLDKAAAGKTASGTPAYMAPEQVKGFFSKQSDMYALGVCLYESLTGHVPWELDGFNPGDNKIIPPSKVSSSIPAGIDDLIEQSLKENPDERISDAMEFWSRLNAVEAA